jgi:2,4-dienoyl-CoA reductase-like NADH-dependent reductase (Old Yellow Enzyme family)
MNSFFPTLFSPLRLRELTLPNRVVMAAMSSKLGTPNGELTDDHFAYYAERARGGVGTIIVEYTCVESRLGRAYAKQLRLDRKEHVEAHRRLATMIAAAGAVPAVQLHHAGRQSWRIPTGCPQRRDVLGR